KGPGERSRRRSKSLRRQGQRGLHARERMRRANLGQAMAEAGSSPIKLPLDAIWRARTSKFGDFAGYDMPLQFEGLIPEHNWTRSHAGLFDVSHMGPSFFALPKGHGLEGDEAHKKIASLIERLVPADIQGLKPGQVRYTMITNEDGGVLDDLMIARPAEPGAAGDLYIVVNAGCKHQDWALIEEATKGEANLVRADDRCLLALQGPTAHEVAAAVIDPALGDMNFMTVKRFDKFGRITVTRSGY